MQIVKSEPYSHPLDDVRDALERAHAFARLIGNMYDCEHCPSQIDSGDMSAALATIQDLTKQALDFLEKAREEEKAEA